MKKMTMKMKMMLLPEPKKVTLCSGRMPIPGTVRIGIASQSLCGAAALIREFFPRTTVNAAVRGVADTISLLLDTTLRPGGYTLRVTPQGVTIAGKTPAAVSHGVQTLRQLAEQSRGALPCVTIQDWPDFPDRGVYYDICRGRVPKLERLMEMADQLARYKVNQLQLYIEHTFAFRGHPRIGQGASPLTAEDILKLDAYCDARGIELVPSLATFGHLATVLKHPEYHRLAEDRGVGKYEAPQDDRQGWQKQIAWSLSPAVPAVYTFLDSLFAEFLPLFRSTRFNICCDETWDLGLGQSYRLCKKLGKGVVYLNHVRKVCDLAAKYGKSVMFWGDIIRHYPDLIRRIPSNVTVLDWAYGCHHAFDSIRDFKVAGLPFFACPGTSSWVSLFPRLPEAMANIHGFAEAGRRHGADGLLNTDWGDGGHYNFMEYSWHGYLFGAEQGWNTGADRASFTSRFAALFFKAADKELARAITELGEVAEVNVAGYYQSLWRHVLFALPGDAVFGRNQPVEVSEAVRGQVVKRRKRVDAAFAARYLSRIGEARKVLAAVSRQPGVDPLRILPYWVFAADTMACAIRKMTVLGPGGKDTPEARRSLKRETASLMARFEKLWMARNRRSEIRITLALYRKAIGAL
jgi:hypothetical protein